MANQEIPSDFLRFDEGSDFLTLASETWDRILAEDIVYLPTEIANRFDMSQNTWDRIMDGEMTVDDTGRDMSGGGNLDG